MMRRLSPEVKAIDCRVIRDHQALMGRDTRITSEPERDPVSRSLKALTVLVWGVYREQSATPEMIVLFTRWETATSATIRWQRHANVQPAAKRSRQLH
jgi:hypothetical protein